MRIISHNRSMNSPLFKKTNVPKSEDKIQIDNIILLSKSINNLLLPVFKNWFIFCS